MEQGDNLHSRTSSADTCVDEAQDSSSISNLLEECAPIMTRALSKTYIVLYVCVGLLLGWLLIPLPYQYGERRAASTRKASVSLLNYFGGFNGFAECNIRAAELYSMPPKDKLGFYDYNTFCHDRKHLLKAMSEGGRVGFDAPYQSQGESLAVLSRRADIIQVVITDGSTQKRCASSSKDLKG